MFAVIGSAPRAGASQQEAPSPPVTFSAALPYLSFTIAFRSSCAIAASLVRSSALDMCAQKRGHSQRFTTRRPDALGLMAATADSISAMASGSRA